jgi:chromosome segregation ATPase
MKSEIKRLNDQINNISSEREQMTIAHQCQIMQLKESFKERYRTNEDWQEKLNADLAKNREKHDADLRRLEASLKENFRIEMEIQQQKYNEMYAKYQQLSRDHGESSRAKISELELDKQRLLVEFKNLHEDKVSTEKKLRQDLESLRAITKDLHERLGELLFFRRFRFKNNYFQIL